MDVIIVTLMVVMMIICSSLDFDEFEVLYYVIFGLPLIFNICQKGISVILSSKFWIFFYTCKCSIFPLYVSSTSSLLGNTKVGFLNLL